MAYSGEIAIVNSGCGGARLDGVFGFRLGGAGFSAQFLRTIDSSRHLGALEGQFIIDLYSSHLARGRRTGYKVNIKSLQELPSLPLPASGHAAPRTRACDRLTTFSHATNRGLNQTSF